MKHQVSLCVFLCCVWTAFSFNIGQLPIGRSNDGRIVCRNEVDGEPLDWFTAYKLPKSRHHPNNDNDFLTTGTAYSMITNKNQQWTLSTLSINDTKSILGQTLAPLYTESSKDDDDIGYVMYNDQADKVTLIKGHTKGVILFDDKTAVWLIHSVPHFPPTKSAGEYLIHPSQCVYGQSMLCMTFNVDDLQKIGLQLLYNYPQVFDHSIPDKLLKSKGSVLDNLVRVVNGDHIKAQPWSNVVSLTTLGGEQLLSFAKTTEFQEDLYAGLVAPTLQSNLLTETWNNGAGTLKSNCSANLSYHVNNIEELSLDFVSPGYKFSVHDDHSKWAVTKSNGGFFGVGLGKSAYSDVRMACIGDINRQEEQFKRGGGTMCFVKNENVWHEYSRIVSDIQECQTVRVHMNRRKWKKVKFNISGEAIVML